MVKGTAAPVVTAACASPASGLCTDVALIAPQHGSIQGPISGDEAVPLRVISYHSTTRATACGNQDLVPHSPFQCFVLVPAN